MEVGMRFGGRYRIETARLRGWDYGATGWYFVTVCTQGLRRWLGDVVAGEVRLSEAGVIVAEELRKTEEVRPNVALDGWTVMPDHLHAIIVIKRGGSSPTPTGTSRQTVLPASRLTPGSLGSIVGQLKSVCTKRIRANVPRDFAWQPRFHDRIIRNETALNSIRRYIAHNPSKSRPNRNATP
jgi:putative transposase